MSLITSKKYGYGGYRYFGGDEKLAKVISLITGLNFQTI